MADEESEFRSAPPALSPLSFLAVLGISLAVFFGRHPEWTELNIQEADANILWSYVPIPPLVFLFLLFERKLGFAAWAIDTLKLTLLKFALTYVFANTIWSLMGGPAPLEESPQAPPTAGSESHTPRRAPDATPLDPTSLRTIEGRITEEDGTPAEGVLVWIARGLSGFDFEPPADPIVFENTGQGFRPALSVVQTYQTISFRGGDGELHTAVASDSNGTLVFNYPALPPGGREVMLDRALGMLRINCSIHGDEEQTAHTLVLDSPFAQVTGAEGRFVFEGVPDVPVELETWSADRSVRLRREDP